MAELMENMSVQQTCFSNLEFLEVFFEVLLSGAWKTFFFYLCLSHEADLLSSFSSLLTSLLVPAYFFHFSLQHYGCELESFPLANVRDVMCDASLPVSDILVHADEISSPDLFSPHRGVASYVSFVLADPPSPSFFPPLPGGSDTPWI